MFVVLRVEAIPEHLRGYLERFLFEARTGLYVGTVSRRVADELWDTVSEVLRASDGDAILIHPTNNEAGFLMRATPNPKRTIVDSNGLDLIFFQTES